MITLYYWTCLMGINLVITKHYHSVSTYQKSLSLELLREEYKDHLAKYQIGPMPLERAFVGTFMEEDKRLTLFSYSMDQVNRLILPMVKEK